MTIHFISPKNIEGGIRYWLFHAWKFWIPEVENDGGTLIKGFRFFGIHIEYSNFLQNP